MAPTGIDTFVDTSGPVRGKVTLPRRRVRFLGPDDRPEELQVWAVWGSLPWRDLNWRSPAVRRVWAGYALSRTIRRFTRPTGGMYSHLLFRQGSGIWEATEDGIAAGLGSSYDRYNLHVDAYAIRADPRQTHAAKLRILAEAFAGTPYDFGDIADRALDEIGEVFGVDVKVKLGAGTSALICSEFVPYVYSPPVDIYKLRHLGPDLMAPLGLREYAEFVPDHIAHLHDRRPELCAYRGRVVF